VQQFYVLLTVLYSSTAHMLLAACMYTSREVCEQKAREMQITKHFPCGRRGPVLLLEDPFPYMSEPFCQPIGPERE
jgi:hypothetical protein